MNGTTAIDAIQRGATTLFGADTRDDGGSFKCCHGERPARPTLFAGKFHLLDLDGVTRRRQWVIENEITRLQNAGVRGKSFQRACRRREFIIASIASSGEGLPV
jgi:hypothetical protein